MTQATKAQEHKPLFIALQPGITKEKFYAKGELDINVFPLILQSSINNRIDFRFLSIINYHLGGDRKEISDVGFSIVMPIYFNSKESLNSRSNGFYFGPVIGLGRNLLNEHNTIILAGELGYHFKADNRFTLTVGSQYGRTYFNYDQSRDIWREHLALAKINLGIWLD